MIADGRQIRRALRLHTVEEGLLHVCDDGGTERLSLCVLGLGPPGSEAGLRTRAAADIPPGFDWQRRYTITFPGAKAVHSFRATLRPTGNEIVVSWPTELTKSGFRASERLAPANGMPLAILHPRFEGLVLNKQIADVSSGGLSFALDPEQDVLFAGERVLLDISDGEIWAEGTIRSVGLRGEDLVCGVELVRFPQRDASERWKSLVFEQGHPSLRLADVQSADRAWEILETSRYVDETTRAIAEHLRAKYRESWNPVSVKSRFGRLLMAFDGEQPVGTASASLIYPGTWLLHHFGIDERRRTADKRFLYEVSHDIYVGMLQLIQQIDDFQHFVILADSSKSWNRMMYGRFVEQYPTQGDFLYESRTVFKCDPCDACDPKEGERGPETPGAGLPGTPSTPVAIEGHWSVREATDDARQLDALARLLETCLPVVERDALALHRDRLDLGVFSAQCARRGYRRERRIWLAYDSTGDGPDPIAALFAELGGEGVNVFSLLNLCWIVRFDPRADHPAVTRLLVTEALRYYAAREVKEALFLGREDEPHDVLEPLGWHHQAGAIRYIGHKRLIPAWLDYVDDFLKSLATPAA